MNTFEDNALLNDKKCLYPRHKIGELFFRLLIYVEHHAKQQTFG